MGTVSRADNGRGITRRMDLLLVELVCSVQEGGVQRLESALKRSQDRTYKENFQSYARRVHSM